jgi:opacity protein-like surface antigen
MISTRKFLTAATTCAALATSAAPALADAQLPDVTTNVNTAPPPPAPPPPPYSLPWQLRPVAAATALRSDTSIALYDNPKNGDESGESIASTFLASYKLTPEIAPLIRLGIVQNSEPGEVRGRATAFVNPIVGVTYARKLSSSFKGAAFLAVALPFGMGGDKKAGLSDTAAAVGRGVQARSAMDNAMFAVNYITPIVGLGGAYIANKLTVQLEATLLQLFRTRNEDISKDSKRTNFTSGLHVGYFLAPFVSLGAEYRYQRWLSDAEPVVANSDARENQTIAIGPRFHFKAGSTWLRPGISYSTAIDKPFSDSHYHMLQVDVPAIF